jgi:predicted metal-dependent hydrolase
MQLESALFFETPDQLYLRILSILYPGANPVHKIEVKFRRYANANSRIRLAAGKLHVDISDLLQSAPAPVQEALAYVLVSKLCRVRIDGKYLARYRYYLSRPDVRRLLEQAKQQRGRKLIRTADSGSQNLGIVFDRLNQRYFGGELNRPRLGWSLRPSRTVLGHYDPCHDVIVINRILDQEDPNAGEILEFVMYHEMLHLKFPTRQAGSKRCIHSKEFKAAERLFEGYKEVHGKIRHMLRSS